MPGNICRVLLPGRTAFRSFRAKRTDTAQKDSTKSSRDFPLGSNAENYSKLFTSITQIWRATLPNTRKTVTLPNRTSHSTFSWKNPQNKKEYPSFFSVESAPEETRSSVQGTCECDVPGDGNWPDMTGHDRTGHGTSWPRYQKTLVFVQPLSAFTLKGHCTTRGLQYPPIRWKTAQGLFYCACPFRARELWGWNQKYEN